MLLWLVAFLSSNIFLPTSGLSYTAPSRYIFYSVHALELGTASSLTSASSPLQSIFRTAYNHYLSKL